MNLYLQVHRGWDSFIRFTITKWKPSWQATTSMLFLMRTLQHQKKRLGTSQWIKTTQNFKAFTWQRPQCPCWCLCPHLFLAWQTLMVTMASQYCGRFVCGQLSGRWMWQRWKGQAVFSEGGKGQGSNRDSFWMKCSGSLELWVVWPLWLDYGEEMFGVFVCCLDSIWKNKEEVWTGLPLQQAVAK